MKNKKKIGCGILLIGILIISINLISAFGFSFPNDIAVYPGENEIKIRVNVAPAEGSMKLKVVLTDESGIVQITDANNIYSVAPGYDNDGIINLRINVPENAVIGQKYAFSLTATEAVQPTGGMVSLASSSSVSLTANVVEKPAPIETPASTEGISLTWWILGIIAVIAVIAIVWFVIKNKEN